MWWSIEKFKIYKFNTTLKQYDEGEVAHSSVESYYFNWVNQHCYKKEYFLGSDYVNIVRIVPNFERYNWLHNSRI